MSFDQFWTYRNVADAEGHAGFDLFSPPHLLWLAVLTTGIAAFAALYCRSGEKRRHDMRGGMALFLIFFEILKQCHAALTGVPSVEHLPLELCSFAEYAILIDAFWPKNRFFRQMLAYVFLPAAIVTVLFPAAVIYPPFNFYTAHQLLLHAGIAAYAVARCAGDRPRTRYPDVWLALAAVVALMLPVYGIDRAFGRNYMFLTSHGDNPVLKLIWEATGGSGGVPYILGLTALVLAVFHVMYFIFLLTERRTRPAGNGGETQR